jgi:hypothetical protein
MTISRRMKHDSCVCEEKGVLPPVNKPMESLPAVNPKSAGIAQAQEKQKCGDLRKQGGVSEVYKMSWMRISERSRTLK